MNIKINIGSVRSARVNFLGGLILETKCIFEYKPSPYFRPDVVYKMGGRINGTLRYMHTYVVGIFCRAMNTLSGV